MQVVELRPKLDSEDLAKALRNIADDIEAGNYDFNPTLAAVVLGTESEHRDGDGITVNYAWQTHGLGKGCFFAFKGLLAVAAAKFEWTGED